MVSDALKNNNKAEGFFLFKHHFIQLISRKFSNIASNLDNYIYSA